MSPGDEMSEVDPRCLTHRQLWMSYLSKVTTQWLEVNSNLRPFNCKAQNIPQDNPVPHHIITLLQIIILIYVFYAENTKVNKRNLKGYYLDDFIQVLILNVILFMHYCRKPFRHMQAVSFIHKYS